jgi:lysine 6-dehydrogenase
MTKKKIILLGAGLVGKAIALDLKKDHNLLVFDNKEENLEFLNIKGIETRKADLSHKINLQNSIQDADIVIGALPGFMGHQTIQAAIESGKNIVDISFLPEDPADLHELAKKAGVTAIYDCGVAPGMGNIILAYHSTSMEVLDYKCYVGGLPFVREWPYEYKAVFSPIDVIEEYTRPARFIVNGDMVVREALSDPELMYFDQVGTLESWNSDGLRSLMNSFKIPNMIEKTLRYPGCIEYLRVLRETGFFSYEEIEVKGQKIRPIDLTAKLLFPKWQLKPGEEDFTIMKILVSGIENNQKITYDYTLFDRFDKLTQTTSMARTTGYTCTAAVNLILKGNFIEKGVFPPESLGFKKSNFDFILNYLKNRKVNYHLSVKKN